MTKSLSSFSIKIPGSAREVSELADYLELNALGSGDSTLSAQDVAAQLTREEDEVENEVKADSIPDYILAAFSEIDRRRRLSSSKVIYPFSSDGDLLTYSPTQESWLYLFCLFATRCNMRDNRIQKVRGRDFDGALLFEEVCQYTLKYFTHVNETIVTGTSRPGMTGAGLKAIISTFLDRYDERGVYSNAFGLGDSQDGGCDLIGWHHYSDLRRARPTFFCSCKTGYSWKQNDEYIPRSGLWSSRFVSNMAFLVDPIPCVMVAEALSTDYYARKIESAKVIGFDRTRVAQAEALVPDLLKRRCIAWMKAVAIRVYAIKVL